MPEYLLCIKTIANEYFVYYKLEHKRLLIIALCVAPFSIIGLGTNAKGYFNYFLRLGYMSKPIVRNWCLLHRYLIFSSIIDNQWVIQKAPSLLVRFLLQILVELISYQYQFMNIDEFKRRAHKLFT